MLFAGLCYLFFALDQHCWVQHVKLFWPSCCMMFYGVQRTLMSIKHLMQHHSTFLHSRTRCRSSLRQEQRAVWPNVRDHYSSQIFDLHNSGPHRTTCCIRLAMQYNTIRQRGIQQCWMMLHSFGQGLTRWKLYSFSCVHSSFIVYALFFHFYFCSWCPVSVA